jgi:hypothetical protein
MQSYQAFWNSAYAVVFGSLGDLDSLLFSCVLEWKSMVDVGKSA